MSMSTKKAYKNKKKVYESLSANKKQKEYEQKKSIQKQLSLAVTNNKNKNTWGSRHNASWAPQLTPASISLPAVPGISIRRDSTFKYQ